MAAAQARGTGVRVIWSDGAARDYDCMWLRDGCGCRQCRHPQTLERTFNLLGIPRDLAAASAESHCNFAADAIRLGGVVPLSAPGSVAGGIGMKWGFEQALADINADCGIEIDGANHRLDLVTGDSEGVSEYGQLVVERLVLQDKVHGIVGFYHSAVGLATMGMVEKYRIPTIYAHPRNDLISAAGYDGFEGDPPRFADGIDYVFRTSPPSSIVGKVVTDWLIEQGVEDVILILENTDYGHPAAVAEGLDAVRAVARGDENMLPVMIAAVKGGVTLGEISDALREVWGTYDNPA